MAQFEVIKNAYRPVEPVEFPVVWVLIPEHKRKRETMEDMGKCAAWITIASVRYCGDGTSPHVNINMLMTLKES
jgi:hypothetical protein